MNKHHRNLTWLSHYSTKPGPLRHVPSCTAHVGDSTDTDEPVHTALELYSLIVSKRSVWMQIVFTHSQRKKVLSIVSDRRWRATCAVLAPLKGNSLWIDFLWKLIFSVVYLSRSIILSMNRSRWPVAQKRFLQSANSSSSVISLVQILPTLITKHPSGFWFVLIAAMLWKYMYAMTVPCNHLRGSWQPIRSITPAI